MKLRIYARPGLAASLLASTAALFWIAAVLVSTPGLTQFLFTLAVFYTLLFLLTGWAIWRILSLERVCGWTPPGRLLVLAPHEDDCAIAAGAVGALNHRLGGKTRIVYLAADEMPGSAEVRAAEARAAWAIVGLPAECLHHLPVLPPLRVRNPRQLQLAAGTLRGVIDDFAPDIVIVPMFEGGHVHHDMLAALVAVVVTRNDRFHVYEAPEYGPYVSLLYTPHRVITLCVRWLFGLVAYYGLPDGCDGRPVQTFRFEPRDLATKRRMLACFISQNAPSLVATRAYPDRLVRMNLDRSWGRPFDFDRSYLRLALAARRLLPVALANALLPTQLGTIGREGSVTDWQQEWQQISKGDNSG
jgi:LmbE family N-acetylglucosaminyl deacetylase